MRYIIALFFLAACHQGPAPTADEIFEAKLYVDWLSAYQVRELGENVINSGKVIERPYNAWISLLRVDFLQQDGVGTRSHCVFYRTPHIVNEKKRPGLLKVVEIGAQEKCVDRYQQSQYLQLGGIVQLHAFYSDRKRMIEGGKWLEANTIAFKFKLMDDYEGFINFPLLNIAGQIAYKRFSGSASNHQFPGLTFWPLKSKDQGRPDGKIQMLGTLRDRYADHTLVQCLQVGDQCQTVGDDNCDRCRYGHFPVLNSKCATRFSRFCGPNNCGQKGEPACLRGGRHAKGIKEICQEGSSWGFCNEGLMTSCDESGVLICM